jgi:hypothetical protein
MSYPKIPQGFNANDVKITTINTQIDTINEEKLDKSDAVRQIEFFFTNTASGEVANAYKLVESTNDSGFPNSNPTVLSTGVLSGDTADQLIGSFVSEPNLIEDGASLDGANIVVGGAIRNSNSFGVTQFYMKAYRLPAGQTVENATAVGVSNNTRSFTSDDDSFVDLSKSIKIVSDATWSLTDRFVFKIFATTLDSHDSEFEIRLNSVDGDNTRHTLYANLNAPTSVLALNGNRIVTAVERDATDKNFITDNEKTEVTKLVSDKQGARDNLEVETTAELNLRDSANRDRANHTGTQLASTISDFSTAVKSNETVTSLSINANILTFTDEDGNETNIDLSLYLDDTNLARLSSGTLDGETGIATFTRDDATTFTVDFSALLDDTKVTVEDVLISTSTENALSANQGKVLKDELDELADSRTVTYPDVLSRNSSDEIVSIGSNKQFTVNIDPIVYSEIPNYIVFHEFNTTTTAGATVTSIVSVSVEYLGSRTFRISDTDWEPEMEGKVARFINGLNVKTAGLTLIP